LTFGFVGVVEGAAPFQLSAGAAQQDHRELVLDAN
jgi:hypothetical protein